jgi:hypothetical protein
VLGFFTRRKNKDLNNNTNNSSNYSGKNKEEQDGNHRNSLSKSKISLNSLDINESSMKSSNSTDFTSLNHSSKKRPAPPPPVVLISENPQPEKAATINRKSLCLDENSITEIDIEQIEKLKGLTKKKSKAPAPPPFVKGEETVTNNISPLSPNGGDDATKPKSNQINFTEKDYLNILSNVTNLTQTSDLTHISAMNMNDSASPTPITSVLTSSNQENPTEHSTKTATAETIIEKFHNPHHIVTINSVSSPEPNNTMDSTLTSNSNTSTLNTTNSMFSSPNSYPSPSLSDYSSSNNESNKSGEGNLSNNFANRENRETNIVVVKNSLVMPVIRKDEIESVRLMVGFFYILKH